MCPVGRYHREPVTGQRPIDWGVLEAAYGGLARLVRVEYPVHRSLAEIAEEWGYGEGLTQEQIEAIVAVEEALGPRQTSRSPRLQDGVGS